MMRSPEALTDGTLRHANEPQGRRNSTKRRNIRSWRSKEEEARRRHRLAAIAFCAGHFDWPEEGRAGKCPRHSRSLCERLERAIPTSAQSSSQYGREQPYWREPAAWRLATNAVSMRLRFELFAVTSGTMV